MSLYRLLQNLAFPDHTLPRGSLSRMLTSKPDVIERLRSKGGIAEIAPPPLAILPGWKLRSAKLAKIGIVSAVDFLETADDGILKTMRIGPDVLAKWRTEVEGWIIRPVQKSSG
jgi:hypothetical protein